MASSQSATPPNIYIIGAGSTGKTTLVDKLHSYFTQPLTTPVRPAIITEVARTILRQHDFTARDILSPARSITLQRLILQAQAAAERDALAGDAGRWFVSDRSGADPIAYATKYVGAEAARGLVEAAEWAELKQRMVKAVVVVCEAGQQAADWLRDDGVRLMPANMEEWVGFHEVFCEFLNSEKVPYEVLRAGVGEHEKRVGFVVQKWLIKWSGRDEPSTLKEMEWEMPPPMTTTPPPGL